MIKKLYKNVLKIICKYHCYILIKIAMNLTSSKVKRKFEWRQIFGINRIVKSITYKSSIVELHILRPTQT